MTDREAMKLALEALDEGLTMKKWRDLVAALRERLAQPEQEFVSWGYRDKRGKIRLLEPYEARMDMFPLYTAPPKREWVGLTGEDRYKAIRPLYNSDENARLAVEHSNDEYEAIEAKLKEKNT